MADTKISALTSAGTLDGTEELALVQSAATKKATTQDVADLYAREFLHVREEQTSGTAGGGSSAGANTRTLNTEKTNTITGASLSSNQITLPAGTYLLTATAPALQTNRHRLYLYNTSDSSIEIVGPSEFNDSSSPEAQTTATVRGVFTIASSKTFELRHDIGDARTSNGLGAAASISGVVEVYAEVLIEKL